MKFKAKLIKPLKLLHFAFDNQIDLTLSFLRPQEYYESPEYREKLFELEEYIAWYCNESGKPKAFDYVTETAGHNLPGCWYRRWLAAMKFTKTKLSPREERIQAEIRQYFGNHDEDFYIIATTADIPNLEGYLAHEIRHAMFYLIPSYKDGILEVLKDHPVKRFRKKLIKDRYNEAVIDDEVHAYALTGFDPYYDCKISELPSELQNLRRALKKVERKFIKKGKIVVPT